MIGRCTTTPTHHSQKISTGITTEIKVMTVIYSGSENLTPITSGVTQMLKGCKSCLVTEITGQTDSL
jgi:hypothetical protein